MTTKHSPAPWTVNGWSPSQAYVETADGTEFWCGGADGHYYHMDIADARLIAAAPELLAALKCLLAHYNGAPLNPCGDSGHSILGQMPGARAEAAIAKAEGGAA